MNLGWVWLVYQRNSSERKKSIFISTGEISGDFYAGEIIKHLQRRNDLEVFALGGENAVQAGAHLVYDTTAIATVGFWELLSTLKQWKEAWNQSLSIIQNLRPAVVVLIDNPGFNLRLARACYRMDIPVISFIPPQVWIWNRRRADTLSRYADWILTIFPWERKYFDGGTAQVKWVGHPVLSKIPDPSGFENGVVTRRIVLLPGSRKREIYEFLQVMKKVLVQFGENHPNFSYSLVSASDRFTPLMEEQLSGLPIVIEKRENLYRVLRGSSLCISCSGTITLEVALTGIPQIIVYRLSKLTYFLARLLLKKRFIGLPNILIGEEICPELIQNDFNSDNVLQTMEKILTDTQMVQTMQTVSWDIRKTLTQGETYTQVIEVIENYLR